MRWVFRMYQALERIDMTITLTREEGYYCVVCGRFLPEEDGVIVHDDVPHPVDMDFGDEEKPQ